MENLGFNLFDAVVIGLIILLSLKGLLSGFTKELFNAIGLIGGLFVASYYKKALATYLHDNFLNSLSMPLLELLSLLVIFISIFIVAKLLYKIVESVSSNDYISGASRLGGMLVKMITLFFVFSLIVFGLSSKPQVVNKFKDVLDSSKLYPLLKSSGALILNTNSEAGSIEETKTTESNATKEETKSSEANVTTKTSDENKTMSDSATNEHKEEKQESKAIPTKEHEVKSENNSSTKINNTKEEAQDSNTTK